MRIAALVQCYFFSLCHADYYELSSKVFTMAWNSGFMLDPRYAESWITASVVWLLALKGVQWIYKGANVEGQKYRTISVLDNWPLRTPLLICWSVGYWQRQRQRGCHKSAYLMHDVCTLCMPYTNLFSFHYILFCLLLWNNDVKW